MPQGFLDQADLTITCPACAHQFHQRIGRLKANPKLTCPRCGRSIQIEGGASLDQANKVVEKESAALAKTIREANKRLR